MAIAMRPFYFDQNLPAALGLLGVYPSFMLSNHVLTCTIYDGDPKPLTRKSHFR